MSFAVLVLLSVKAGAVRGCLNGSLWLKSAVLVSVSPALPIYPESAKGFRVLPAPGARSKFSSMTAGFVSLGSQNGIRKKENCCLQDGLSFLLRDSNSLFYRSKARPISLSCWLFCCRILSQYIYNFLVTSFHNKLAAIHCPWRFNWLPLVAWRRTTSLVSRSSFKIYPAGRIIWVTTVLFK